MSIDKSIEFPSDPKVGDVFCVQHSRVPAPKGWTFYGVNYDPRTDTAFCMYRYVGVRKVQGNTLAKICKEQAETIEQQAREIDILRAMMNLPSEAQAEEIQRLKGQIATLNTDLSKFRRAHSEQCEILAKIPVGEIDATRDIISMGKQLGKLKGECVQWRKMYQALVNDYEDLSEKTASLQTQIRKRDEMIVGLRKKSCECAECCGMRMGER